MDYRALESAGRICDAIMYNPALQHLYKVIGVLLRAVRVMSPYAGYRVGHAGRRVTTGLLRPLALFSLVGESGGIKSPT